MFPHYLVKSNKEWLALPVGEVNVVWNNNGRKVIEVCNVYSSIECGMGESTSGGVVVKCQECSRRKFL